MTDPTPPPEPPVKPSPKYSPFQKKALQKVGEALSTAGTGASGLTVLQPVIEGDLEGKNSSVVAGLFVLGLVFVLFGIYLQAEAER